MKKTITLLCFLFFITLITSAQVIEDVHFDYYQSVTNNDFVNNFSNGYGLSQSQSNGITGGCLLVPDSINWGNDNANYCSRYAPVTGDTTGTSICFKYDTTLINLPSYQRALSIWLWPNADFNHYIVASITGNKKLELLTYGWNNNPYPNLSLLEDHWYRYELRAVFAGGINHQVLIHAEVSDLGTAGTSIPVTVNTSSGTINDSTLVGDTAIHVAISGSKFGGALYLDDFRFDGRRGSTNCINTTGLAEEQLQPIHVYPSPAGNYFFIERNDFNGREMILTIYDLAGKKLKEILSISKETTVDVSSLSGGMYIVNCRSASTSVNFKIEVQK